MKPVIRALAGATGQLANVSDTPRLDAELLMAHALGIERDTLLLSPPDGPAPDMFLELVGRRLKLEPVAYITGRRAFWNIELVVGPGVLIPRPDSETLIASAVEHFAGQPGPRRILDLGTGPGTLLLAALDQWPKATGLGVDSSEVALGYAMDNARRLGLAERAEFRLGDWAADVVETFDLVLINPPYVAVDAHLDAGVAAHEPHEALFAGADGLEDFRRLAPQVGRLLNGAGLAVIEIGHDQARSVPALLRKHGHEPRLAHDLAGRARAVLI